MLLIDTLNELFVEKEEEDEDAKKRKINMK